MKSRFIIWILTAALIASTCLLGLCRLNSYKNRLRYRLDPLETGRLEPGPVPVENGFWIIGDSRAAAWEGEGLGFIGTGISNLGINGQTSRQVLERFRNDLDQSMPFCILIQVGINDLKSIGLLDDGSITRNCIRHIRQILETCKKNEINAIYSSIFPPGDIEVLRRPFWDPTIIDSLRMVNREIMDYCRENGFIYLDTYKLLEDRSAPGTVEKGYQSDFLHINPAGYQRISEALRNRLLDSGEEWVNDLMD